MALATARAAAKPDKRKGRPGRRPSLNHNTACDSLIVDSAIALQRQCLGRLGLFGFRADLVAALVWSDGGNRAGGGFL